MTASEGLCSSASLGGRSGTRDHREDLFLTPLAWPASSLQGRQKDIRGFDEAWDGAFAGLC